MDNKTLPQLVSSYYEKNDYRTSSELYYALFAIGKATHRSHFNKMRREDAEDIIQDKTIELMKLPGKIDPEQNCLGFVKKSYFNAFQSKSRSQRELCESDLTTKTEHHEEHIDFWESFGLHESRTADHLILKKEEKEMLLRQLPKLGKKQREVVRLRVLENFTPFEIEKALHMTRTQVDNSFCLVKKKLIELINKYENH